MCHKGKITSRYSHRITVIKVICSITNKLEFYVYVLFLCLLFHAFMASSSQFDARNLLKENFLHAILFPVDAGHEAIYWVNLLTRGRVPAESLKPPLSLPFMPHFLTSVCVCVGVWFSIFLSLSQTSFFVCHRSLRPFVALIVAAGLYCGLRPEGLHACCAICIHTHTIL